MIDYTKWKVRDLVVTNLLLDANNPRVPGSGKDLSQRDLIADLVQNDHVLELAKRVVDNGYYPVEKLIVIKEDKKFVVLEGNRRAAALKLLLSPESAPDDKWVSRFRALANRIDQKSIRTVGTIEAPSRDAAAPIIMSRHTRNEIEKWSPVMQAKFYWNLLQRGLTADDISEQYHLPAGEIADALQLYTMYAAACKLDLPEEVAAKVQNPREFRMTNLERLYKTEEVQRFLGISFDKNRNLKGKVHVDEFRKGYSKIVTDIAQRAVHSRDINTTEDIEGYLSCLDEARPNLKKTGKFTAETLLTDSSEVSSFTSASAREKKTRRQRTSHALIPKAMICEVDNQRINDMFGELQKLSVAAYPNSTALVFRCFLELTLGHFLDRTGHLEKLTESERNKRQKKNNKLPKDWHPTLTEMLKYAASSEVGIIGNANLRRALKKLISEKEKFLSVDTLNLFAHNQHWPPDATKLRAFMRTP